MCSGAADSDGAPRFASDRGPDAERTRSRRPSGRPSVLPEGMPPPCARERPGEAAAAAWTKGERGWRVTCEPRPLWLSMRPSSCRIAEGVLHRPRGAPPEPRQLADRRAGAPPAADDRRGCPRAATPRSDGIALEACTARFCSRAVRIDKPLRRSQGSGAAQASRAARPFRRLLRWPPSRRWPRLSRARLWRSPG